jgi:transcriptional regulator with XRE-family HTH domain
MARKTTQSREIDQHVGRRIRLLRLQRGWSQQELADRLGISYQQLHKYENGSNSISAGRMADVAAQLRCNPAVFFAGLGEEESGSNIPDELTDREQVLLARNFSRIRCEKQREVLKQFILQLAEEKPGGEAKE